MIFDSPQIEKLKNKYANRLAFETPKILHLASDSELNGERDYIENIFATVTEKKQKDWLSRLLNGRNDSYLGAWFEIILCGWLREVGKVTVEPNIEGNYPEFLLDVASFRVIIEARAYQISQVEVEQEKRIRRVMTTLTRIKKPYLLSSHQHNLEENLDIHQLVSKVEDWLEHNPERDFTFRDSYGNMINFSADLYPRLKNVEVSLTTVEYANPEPLRGPLHKKAKQHKSLRRAGYPYVIAILAESRKLSAQEFVEAWFGTPQVTIDISTKEIVDEHFDQSGLHFLGPEVQHRTVSGTLVFRAEMNSKLNRRELKGRYIQNPFSNVPVDWKIFPVESAFVVVKKEGSRYGMAWQRREK